MAIADDTHAIRILSMLDKSRFGREGSFHVKQGETFACFTIYFITITMSNQSFPSSSQLNGTAAGQHLKWFNDDYLEYRSNDYLLADIIRYVIGFVHPSNEIIASSIMPRYQLVFFLAKPRANQNSLQSSSVKHAVVFDWYFYTLEKDNIMSIGEIFTNCFCIMPEPMLYLKLNP